MKKLTIGAIAVAGAVGLVLVALTVFSPTKANAQFGTPVYGAFETNLTQALILETDTTSSPQITNYLPKVTAVADEIILQAPAAAPIAWSLASSLTPAQTSNMVQVVSNAIYTIHLSGIGGYNGPLSVRVGVGTVQSGVSTSVAVKVIGHY